MTSKREVLRQQRRWAESVGLDVDPRGYLEIIDANLFQPLSPRLREAFKQGSGAEITSRGGYPAKMQAVHSSAVLAVNVFDHWSGRDAAPLLRALGVESRLAAPPRFEAQYKTGLLGNPPNLDVVLELESGRVIGIESKFTEWLTRQRPGRAPFKDKYFAAGGRLWADRGLVSCQALAEAMMACREPFRVLDAAQLLKHALGLATQRPGEFALHYVYFDIDCPASAVHRLEIERFARQVGAELGFVALSYQTLCARFRERGGVDADYLEYLRGRYGL